MPLAGPPPFPVRLLQKNKETASHSVAQDWDFRIQVGRAPDSIMEGWFNRPCRRLSELEVGFPQFCELFERLELNFGRLNLLQCSPARKRSCRTLVVAAQGASAPALVHGHPLSLSCLNLPKQGHGLLCLSLLLHGLLGFFSFISMTGAAMMRWRSTSSFAISFLCCASLIEDARAASAFNSSKELSCSHS